MTSKKKSTKNAYRMMQIQACPFCGGELTKKYSGLNDRLNTTTKTFALNECSKCSAGILNPMPIGDASIFYPSQYLSAEQQKKASQKRFDLEKWYRYNQYAFDFNLLERASGISFKNATSYVDIGCGSGERVTFASEQGCDNAWGVDKFDFAKSKSKNEVKIINSDILAFKPKKKFQIVSLFHVLEHLENPHEVLDHLQHKVLDKKGYIIIQVPNYGSIERRIFKSRWFCLDVPRHVWQFNTTALGTLLDSSGYKVDAVYQLSAPLHPVTIVPSIFKELDIQRIWVNKKHGNSYKKIMTLLWAGLTVISIPLAILQNIFKRSSMLTVIASSK